MLVTLTLISGHLNITKSSASQTCTTKGSEKIDQRKISWVTNKLFAHPTNS